MAGHQPGFLGVIENVNFLRGRRQAHPLVPRDVDLGDAAFLRGRRLRARRTVRSPARARRVGVGQAAGTRRHAARRWKPGRAGWVRPRKSGTPKRQAFGPVALQKNYKQAVMSTFERDEYKWRETYFVLFDSGKRPTLKTSRTPAARLERSLRAVERPGRRGRPVRVDHRHVARRLRRARHQLRVGRRSPGARHRAAPGAQVVGGRRAKSGRSWPGFPSATRASTCCTSST